ncbi:tetratricopeptide repeat protein [Micromonospora sp. RP3T]|uniref:tetratricopeptide repeat protein n=1 Tax=Micromonospora sp. RP3T TaxID=2135446 RepID=UPI000D1636D4|nr:tetratricopeptide repeat protein [Micromonospora sp. RP3T]PTA47471.1 tetratricopeptide repeat protein [Micromonospora sp. RP3T]
MNDQGDGLAGDRVDASHAQGLQIGEGNTQNNTFYFRGRREVSWPHQVGVVPPLADRRQRRQADKALTAGVAGGTVMCQVLAGMGGVGKTQVAANFAHQLQRDRDIDLLVWVAATSRSSVVISYAQAAAEITSFEDSDPEQAAARLLAWLASTDKRWLIVLDDLADPADMRGLWPPAAATGSTVVTSRRRDAALLNGRNLIEVDPFTCDEALAYLEGKLGDAAHRLDEAAQLVEDLGWLPLALAQAVTYILDQDLTCARYRQRLAGRRLATLHPHLLPDDQARSVADTWRLSVDLAGAATGGTARILLQIASMLDPNGIPLNLFDTPAVAAYCEKHLGRPVDADDTHDAIRTLHRLGLASITQDSATLYVHSLIQRATRDQLAADEFDRTVSAAADGLLEVWSKAEMTGGAGILCANADALHVHAGPRSWATGVYRVLFRVGLSLDQAGLIVSAGNHWQDLYAMTKRHLGPDHPDTFTARSRVADWQGRAGDLLGAVMTLEMLLADRLRVVGPDHPDTLATRQRIAERQALRGDRLGAVATFEALLADRLRVLGPDHPDTLATRHEIATWRGVRGDQEGAVAATEELLDARLRALGHDHRETLATRRHLAERRAKAGDLEGAIAEAQQLFADQIRLLGPDHREAATTCHLIAEWRLKADDAEGAVAALEDFLAALLQAVGRDHRETLRTRHRIAEWRGEAGDWVGAVAAFEDLLADRLRLSGPDDSDTLATRHRIAEWRAKAGDAVGAVTALEELLADQQRALDPDHPDILLTHRSIAAWRADTGDWAGAVAALEVLLTVQLRVSGPDRRDTLAARAFLADRRGRAGDVEGALAALEEVLISRVQVLGPYHRDTFATRRALAGWRGRAGDWAGAVAETEALLADQLRRLGPNHRDTFATRGALADRRGRAGDWAGAVAETEALLADQLRVIGPRHPDALRTRGHLANRRRRAGTESPRSSR